MKVILIQDVPKIGRKYEVKEVKEGFGRNFLLPRHLAVLWSAAKEAEYKTKIEMVKTVKNIDDEIAEKNLASLNNIQVDLSCVANKEGHLFAGIKSSDIVHAIKEQKGIEVPESLIELEHPIKNIGAHRIKAGNAEFTLQIRGAEK